MKNRPLLRTLSILILVLLQTILVPGQKSTASPRDSVKAELNKSTITINYGSPSVKERKIWGHLVPYNKVWRAGANEATRFSTSKPIQVEGKELPAGEYGLFAIPGEKEWTIIFNKVARQWGAYEYAEREDALRVQVQPKKSESKNERLVYRINDKGVQLLWEELEVPISIK